MDITVLDQTEMRGAQSLPPNYAALAQIQSQSDQSKPEPPQTASQTTSLCGDVDLSWKLEQLEGLVDSLKERLARVEIAAPVGLQSAQRRPSATPSSSSFETTHQSLILESPQPVDSPQNDPTFIPALPLKSSQSPSGSADLPETVWPLYQRFRSSLDPLLRLVHRPSIQHLFLATSEELKDVPADLAALRLAICFAAASSMHQDMNGSAPPTSRLREQYAEGCEASLSRAQLLAAPTMAGLQALMIYLTYGRRFLGSVYVWSLTAVLVRLAMKLKLHLDPETQGLTFVECEYRRRLWWQLMSLDASTADGNETDPLINERQYTTKFPSAVQDKELVQPSSPKERTHSPDMFPSLVRFEITYYVRTLLFSEQFNKANGYPNLSAEGKLSIVESLEVVLHDKYFRKCPCEPGPCALTVATSKITVARLKLVIYKEMLSSPVGNAQVAENMLKACVQILAATRALRTDPVLSHWSWLHDSNAEWDTAATCLTLLAHSHAQSLITTQAWNAVEAFFSAWKHSVRSEDRMKQWARLKGLKAKALQARARVLWEEVQHEQSRRSVSHQHMSSLVAEDGSPIARRKSHTDLRNDGSESRVMDAAFDSGRVEFEEDASTKVLDFML